jgi:hypothetical protein
MFLFDGSKGLHTSDMEQTASLEVLTAVLSEIQVLRDGDGMSWLPLPRK